MQWLLHVGTTKTGSKAIQHFLATTAETLNGPRIVFPKTGRCGGVWHEELFYALDAGQCDMLAAARTEAIAAGADHAVLSYEGFYQLPLESIALIKDVLGPARILLFIRRQDSHANSWYNQLIKAHRVTFSAIDEFERNVSTYDPMLDHWATIEKWSAVFGADAIQPVVYDKSRSSVDVLLEMLHICPPVGGRSSPNPNSALTPPLAATLRAIKEQVGDSPRLAEIVGVFHQEHVAEFMDTYAGDTVYLLDPSVRAAIMDNYQCSNEMVRRCHFPQREALFAALPPGSEATLDLEWGREEARRFLRRDAWAGVPALTR
jgi:hypothetical protein